MQLFEIKLNVAYKTDTVYIVHYYYYWTQYILYTKQLITNDCYHKINESFI